MPGERGRIGPTGPVVSDYIYKFSFGGIIYSVSASKCFLFFREGVVFQETWENQVHWYVNGRNPSISSHLSTQIYTFTSD